MGVIRDAALTDHGFDQEDRPRLPAMIIESVYQAAVSRISCDQDHEPDQRLNPNSETTDEKEQQQGSNCTRYSTWTWMVLKLDLDRSSMTWCDR